MDQGPVNEPMAYGLNDLHTAVISGQTRRLVKILRDDNKEIIDAGDVDGTTPLMAAVLTGRLTISRLLIRSGASIRARDRQGRNAIDYSRSSLFPKKLQLYRHLGLLTPVSPKQHRSRVLIAQILRYPSALESCRRGGNHECSRAVFVKHGKRLKVLRPDLVFKVAKENLERGTSGFITSAKRPDVKTAAVSGWRLNEGRGADVLDNVKYFKLVEDFASILHFELAAHYRDKNGMSLPEHHGRFNTSHVEKKLAVFWVIAALRANLDTTDISRTPELRDADLPEVWKEAWIFLDHIPCDNCWGFLAAIKHATGIEIYVDTRPFLIKGNRKAASGCKQCSCDRCKKKFGVQQARNSKVGSEGCDDDATDESMMATERIVAYGDEAALEPEAGHCPGVGDDEIMRKKDDSEGQCRSVLRNSGCEALPAPSKPPQSWRQYGSDDAGRSIAKPVSRPLEHFPTAPPQVSNRLQDGHHIHESQTASAALAPQANPPPDQESLSDMASGFQLREPVSTMAGRSAFFTTPDLPRSVEVRIPRMSLRVRAEYDRLSDISGTRPARQRSGTPGSVSVGSKGKKSKRRTIQKSLNDLNLGQFAFQGLGPSTATTSAHKKTGQQRELVKTGIDGKITKATVARTKPRPRTGKDEKTRARSTFARAMEHHERRKRGKP